MNKKENLIDLLYEKSGICYLSDLHLSQFYPQFLNLLKNTKSQDYDLKDWIELSNYMLNQNEVFSSAEDVRQHLLEALVNSQVKFNKVSH